MFPADVVPSQTHMALPSVAHVSSWKMTSPQRGFNTPNFTALTCGASEDKWFLRDLVSIYVERPLVQVAPPPN